MTSSRKRRYYIKHDDLPGNRPVFLTGRTSNRKGDGA